MLLETALGVLGNHLRPSFQLFEALDYKNMNLSSDQGKWTLTCSIHGFWYFPHRGAWGVHVPQGRKPVVMFRAGLLAPS